MTIGERRVRPQFNPSGNQNIAAIKELSAALIDKIAGLIKEGYLIDTDDCALFLEYVEDAQKMVERAAMLAVKAASF